MLRLAPKQLILKPPSKYDIPGFATSEQRKLILQRALERYPKLQIKGGTAKTNPYKIQYEVIIAEKRTQLAYYENSILWSPRYTPRHFKFLFLYPTIAIIFFCFYLRYIALPRRMLYLRRKYGYKFNELEQKGWLDGWIDDEIVEEVYGDWTLRDLEEFDKLTTDEKINTKERASVARKKNQHADMQNKLNEINIIRKDKELEVQ